MRRVITVTKNRCNQSQGPHAGRSDALRVAEARAEVWPFLPKRGNMDSAGSPLKRELRSFTGTFIENPAFHAAIAQTAPYLNRDVAVDLRVGGIMGRPTPSPHPARNKISALYCMSQIDTGGSILLAADWYRLQTYVLQLRKAVRETIGPGASFDHVRLVNLKLPRYLDNSFVPVFTNGQIPVRNAPAISPPAAQLLLGFAGPPPPNASHAYAYDAPTYGVIAWVSLLRLLQVLHWSNTATHGVTVRAAGGATCRPLFGAPLSHPGRDALLHSTAVAALRRLAAGSAAARGGGGQGTGRGGGGAAAAAPFTRVIDVACGTGSAGAALVAAGLVGRHLLALDLVPAAAETAARLCESVATSAAASTSASSSSHTSPLLSTPAFGGLSAPATLSARRPARAVAVHHAASDLLAAVPLSSARADLIVAFLPRVPLSRDEAELLAPSLNEAAIATDPTRRPTHRSDYDDVSLPHEAVDVYREVGRPGRHVPTYRQRVGEDGNAIASTRPRRMVGVRDDADEASDDDADGGPSRDTAATGGAVDVDLSRTGAVSYPPPRADGFVPYVPLGDVAAAMRSAATTSPERAATANAATAPAAHRRRYRAPTPEASERAFAVRGSITAFESVGALRHSWRHAALDSGVAVEAKTFYAATPAASAEAAAVLRAAAEGKLDATSAPRSSPSSSRSPSSPSSSPSSSPPTNAATAHLQPHADDPLSPPSPAAPTRMPFSAAVDPEIAACALPPQAAAAALLAGGRLFLRMMCQAAPRLNRGGLVVTASSTVGAAVGRDRAPHGALDAAVAAVASGPNPLFELAHVEDISCRGLYSGPDASVDPWSLRPDRELDPVLAFRGDGWTGEKDLDADQQRDLLARLYSLRAAETLRLVILRRTHHVVGGSAEEDGAVGVGAAV